MSRSQPRAPSCGFPLLAGEVGMSRAPRRPVVSISGGSSSWDLLLCWGIEFNPGWGFVNPLGPDREGEGMEGSHPVTGAGVWRVGNCGILESALGGQGEMVAREGHFQGLFQN